MGLKKNTLQKLSEYLPQSKIIIFDKYYNTLKNKDEKAIFDFCLNYTLDKNQNLLRKTGLPNVSHPLNVALYAINHKLEYTQICASLLHDVLEDKISYDLKKEEIKDKKDSKIHLKIRRKLFFSLRKELIKLFPQIKKDSKTYNDISAIVGLVDVLTRYRTPIPHYYNYVRHNFGRKNKKNPPEIISKALIIKFLDRVDNIQSMDTHLKKIIHNKIDSELKILGFISSPRLKSKYKKLIDKQFSFLVDYSFSGGNRLNQLWKNAYLLMRSRMYYFKYNIYNRTPTALKIEKELIDESLKVINNHKNNLRIYLKNQVTKHWDEMAKKYSELGGLNGKTKEYKGKMKKNKEYLIFNSALGVFSQFLLKNNKEFKKLQIDKLSQYKYLCLIQELLKKFKQDPKFICDLSKNIEIK